MDTNDQQIGEVTEPVTSLKISELWPDWQAEALCAGEGYEKYFGTDSDIRPTMSTRQVRQAQATCFACPVLEQCISHALYEGEEYGVWGGTSGRTRRRIWRWIRNGWVSTNEVVADILAGDVKWYEKDEYSDQELVAL